MGKSVRKEVEEEVGHTLYESLDLTKDVLEGTFNLALDLLTFFQLFALLFLVGEGIIFTRLLLAEAGGIIAAFASALVPILTLSIDAFDIIDGVINFLTAGIAHLPTFPLLDPTAFFKDGWVDRISNVETECVKFTTWQETLGFFLGQLTKDNLCVFLRYIEPVPWLYNILHGALDWVTVDPTPAPDGGNCEDNATEWFCASLGLGYVIVYLLIPLLLVFLIIKAYKPVLVQIISWSWTLVHFVFHLIFVKLLKGGCHSLEDIRCYWENFLCQRILRSR